MFFVVVNVTAVTIVVDAFLFVHIQLVFHGKLAAVVVLVVEVFAVNPSLPLPVATAINVVTFSWSLRWNLWLLKE